MFNQIVEDIDARQDANAEQLRIFRRPTTDFFGMQYIPRDREMAMTTQGFPYKIPREVSRAREQFVPHKQQICGEEPEDAILVASGLLPRLVARARLEPPSTDWERDLNEI